MLKVSAVITAHNGVTRHLEQVIMNVLGQTFRDASARLSRVGLLRGRQGPSSEGASWAPKATLEKLKGRR